MVAGTAYLADAFVTLIVPQYVPLVSPITLPLEVAELPIILWLVIWGAKTRSTTAAPALEAAEGHAGPMELVSERGMSESMTDRPSR